jgi:aspartate 1-decarboxylase
VTEANLHYVGSLTVDEQLLELSDILPYEQVHVVNVNNGQRLVTYAISGARGSGVMCLNGAAARCGQPGDTIIVIAYGQYTDAEARQFTPRVVLVDEHNQPVPEAAALAGSNGFHETAAIEAEMLP